MDAATTRAVTDLKFRLVRESFAEAVSWVAKNLPSRPTVPVLSGVLLTGSDDGLTISGFDYEVSAEVQVAAEIASPGSVLVSGRLLSDITRALPNKPVDFYVDGNRVALTCGSARFSLPTMAASAKVFAGTSTDASMSGDNADQVNSRTANRNRSVAANTTDSPEISTLIPVSIGKVSSRPAAMAT
ncbi:hypothetical protein A9W94_01840 [Mycobacterium asiaticum]|nr:hypothetical protein A9W94_01840 [Mycobacterium asiaticum]